MKKNKKKFQDAPGQEGEQADAVVCRGRRSRCRRRPRR
jgi:hypothetical protein